MKTLLSLGLIFLYICTSQCQEVSGGEFAFQKNECISDTERAIINQQIEYNIKKYKINIPQKSNMIVLYDWPLVQNPLFEYNSTFAISNYVDHNASYPNQLLDYNCGDDSYDTPSGYNHQGIDVFLWPFDHNQVANDQTWVVAAADGTILNKNDGEIDDNCSFNSNNANFVILSHSDGSRSWYWHLKKNSVTSKSIGQTVTKGEYLGVVASSGNSTGPHLHFECYDSSLSLIDPFAGTCNSMNGMTSYWESQMPYWEPTINALITHDAPPSFQACPNQDIINEANNFDPNDLVYFASYTRDQQSVNTVDYTIKRPDGTTWLSWNHNSPLDYRAAYWYWAYYLPSDAMTGVWTWNATINGNMVSRNFQVGPECPSSYSDANGNALTGTQNSSADFETDGIIESDQLISGASTEVYYDSGTAIFLHAGFEVVIGAIIEIIIDGCGGSQ